MVQLADQLHWSRQRMKASSAVIADMHHPPANRATTITNIEFPQGKVRVFAPDVWHPAGLQAKLKSIEGVDQTRTYTRKRLEYSPYADR